ncbi:MAG TPA: hypothetical protein VGD60_05035 [Candidatus Acidoferrales bacterium]
MGAVRFAGPRLFFCGARGFSGFVFGGFHGWLGCEFVDYAAAIFGAAVAGGAGAGGGKTVVDQEFFALADFAAAEIEDVAAQAADVEIRVATVIDDYRAVAVIVTIDEPDFVEKEEGDAENFAGGPGFSKFARGLAHADARAFVFDDLVIGGNGFEREDSPTMDVRAADFEAKGTFAGG